MADIVVILGAVLCVLSVIAGIIAVLRTQAPRGAAVLLLAGFALLAAGAWLEPGGFHIPDIAESWARLTR